MTSTLQQRQDVQLNKLQIKFLGWMLSPKLRYFLYAWSSNASQGLGAQVVLAGNLNYKFNDHFTLAGGIRSLPGTRSVEGNFPFWLGVDTRLITDEFFRPSYTSGIWASGNITKTLNYQAMVGNNLSTLGVSAAQLDNRFNTVAPCWSGSQLRVSLERASAILRIIGSWRRGLQATIRRARRPRRNSRARTRLRIRSSGSLMAA